MLGKVDRQDGLFRPDREFRDHVGTESFYGFLHRTRLQMFRDEDFASLFGERGRPSVPPTQLCVALILQAHDGVSDHEAIERTAYDLRWKVALGLELKDQLCAKSTLQLFRAKLILNERYQAIFEASIEECRRSGLLGRGKLEVAIDTTPIFGKGAVKDTFNLVADQIRRVVEEVVKLDGSNRDEVVQAQGLSRYFASSFKGAVEIDWSDKDAKRALVGQLVADARVALELAKQALRGHDDKSTAAQPLREARQLLSDLLLQDIEEKPEDGGGPTIRQGTSKDRVISTTDTDARHGTKSGSNRFNGHKASVIADTATGVILGTDVIAGNAHDSQGAAELVRTSSERSNFKVERVLGDTAYGSKEVREALSKVADEVAAKAPPASHKKGKFSVDDFEIDHESGEATCPAGKKSAARQTRSRNDDPGYRYLFAVEDCNACALRALCTDAAARSLIVTEVTKSNQAVRSQQRQPEFLEIYRRRVVIEHRLARLIQLGMRKARFFGRAKTRFQVAMAATVANLSLVAC